MDAIERKARSLARERRNMICDTCKNFSNQKCEVVDDPNKCIYNNMELWQPRISVFLKLAEKILEQ